MFIVTAAERRHRGGSPVSQSTRSNEELFRRVVESLNERDEAAFRETHVADVVLHDHDTEHHGVDAAVEHEWTMYEAFPDAAYAVEDVVTTADRIAARWRVTGTHEGGFQGIEPTGEAVDVPACGTLRVEDGRVAEVWIVYDRLGLLEQLGVVEPPSES